MAISQSQTIRGLLIAGLCALYLGLLFPSPEYCIYNKDDAGSFLTMGLNLTNYGHYSGDTFPKEDYGHHGTWPPVFPAILGCVIRLFGLNWVALKVAMALFGLGNLWLLWLLFRQLSADRPGSQVASWTVGLTALSPMYFLFSHTTMTEIPFMFASTAALLLIVRAAGWQGALLAGLVASAAFFTRGYAVVFLPVGILAFLLKQDWPRERTLVGAACFALPLLASIVFWFWYTRHVVATQTLDGITAHYGNVGVLAANGQRPWTAFLRDIYWYHLRFVVHSLLPFLSKDIALSYDAMAGVGGLLLAGVLAGVALWFRRGDRTVGPWLLASAAVMLVGGITGGRYYLTYLPFLLFFLLSAFEQWSASVKRLRLLFPAVASLLLLGMTLGMAKHLLNPDALRYASSYWKEYQAATAWAREKLPPDAVLVNHSPHIAFSSSGLRAVGGPPPEQSEWPPKLVAEEPHIYILGPKTQQNPAADVPRTKEFEAAREWIDRDPRFDVVFDGDYVRIWRFRR